MTPVPARPAEWESSWPWDAKGRYNAALRDWDILYKRFKEQEQTFQGFQLASQASFPSLQVSVAASQHHGNGRERPANRTSNHGGSVGQGLSDVNLGRASDDNQPLLSQSEPPPAYTRNPQGGCSTLRSGTLPNLDPPAYILPTYASRSAPIEKDEELAKAKTRIRKLQEKCTALDRKLQRVVEATRRYLRARDEALTTWQKALPDILGEFPEAVQVGSADTNENSR
ncbi:hypothetical protein BDV96DRAFT_590569 [Lophiotrema nucula]|uniref:Uncharacterized protein n=1 Tax=Lophiotrema nucula TaxID=690887 RepID=A0A6A5YIG1_9PLEO|nr:hypothetical protein BDV96DRAFT_590569 [Lophiotrema nucula]